MLLITGSEGLIGSALSRALIDQRQDLAGIDLKESTIGGIGTQGNILDEDLMQHLVGRCSGIIHLAAVSRVIDGQKNPELCYQTNVEATSNIIKFARESDVKPWVVYASSREIYGEPGSLPVTEDFPRAPVNVYGESKLEAEKIIESYAPHSATSILRFSNVYGNVAHDHDDRVVPAFAMGAANQSEIRVDGKDNSFDFTHLSDTVDGILRVIKELNKSKQAMDPIHFVTGQETSLDTLSQMAYEESEKKMLINHAPSRDYDVSNFVGSYNRAQEVLNWTPKVGIQEGFKNLVTQYKEQRK